VPSDEPDGPRALIRRAHAVVFDCDGVLFDTERLWALAEQRTLEALGGRWHPALRARTAGAAVPEAAGILAGAAGRPERGAETAALLEAEFEELVERRGAPVLAGAAALVRELHGTVPLGVASNNSAPLLERLLARGGMLEAFDAVVGLAPGVQPKPHPDTYRTACVRLGIEPTSACALEDTETGLRAALAAGLAVIVVGPGPDRFGRPRVNSLDELCVLPSERPLRRRPDGH